MSGKGCQLLVSPCNVSPSMSMIRGHQPQPFMMPVAPPQRSERSEKAKRGTVQSGKPSGSHVVLPTLSLRRQVLTNAKHPTGPNAPPPQQPANHFQNTTMTTNKPSRLSPSNHSFKGKHNVMLLGGIKSQHRLYR